MLNDRYCGTALYCLGAVPTATTGAAATDATVCSNQKPFKISVETDGLEYIFPTAISEGAIGNNAGFSISNSLSSYPKYYAIFYRLFHEDNLSDQAKLVEREGGHVQYLLHLMIVLILRITANDVK